MTPLVAEAHQTRKRFHAEIAMKARAVKPRIDHSYSIPNTPYGVPKIPAPVIVHVPMSLGMIEYHWRSMWFYDLVATHIPPDPVAPKIEHIQRIVARHTARQSRPDMRSSDYGRGEASHDCDVSRQDDDTEVIPGNRSPLWRERPFHRNSCSQ